MKEQMKQKEKLTSKWSLKEPMFLDKKDTRYKKHKNDLKKYGFSDAETWALNSVITQFVLPRLKRFRELHICRPAHITMKEWDEILDKMIYSFEFDLDDFNKTKDDWKKHQEGLDLFAKYFLDLWW